MDIETIENSNFLYAVEVVNNPSLTETEDFRIWIGDEDNKKLYNDLRLFREAGQISSASLPSHFVSDQLKALHNKVNMRKTRLRRRKLIAWTAGVASVSIIAIFLLNLLFSNGEMKTDYIPEFVALEAPQQVTLQIDGAEPIALEDSSLTKMSNNTKPQNLISYIGKTLPDVLSTAISEKVHTLKITIPRGQMYTITLSDGTQVWLNTGSSLKYPSQFDSKSRTVELSGEAYFKVARNENSPFIVKTDYITTRVLGTEFNIRAYNEADVSVTLVNGKVEVESPNTERLTLKPNECATIKASKLQSEVVDVKKYTAWVDGYFYFDNASLEDIMKELGRWYNINIEFANTSTREYKYKFWADRNGRLEEAVDLLNEYGKASIIVQNKRLIIYK